MVEDKPEEICPVKSDRYDRYHGLLLQSGFSEAQCRPGRFFPAVCKSNGFRREPL